MQGNLSTFDSCADMKNVAVPHRTYELSLIINEMHFLGPVGVEKLFNSFRVIYDSQILHFGDTESDKRVWGRYGEFASMYATFGCMKLGNEMNFESLEFNV